MNVTNNPTQLSADPNVQIPVDSQAAFNPAAAAEATKEVAELLGGNGVNVSRTQNVNGATGKDGKLTPVPLLEDADEMLALEADLATLIAFLKMETDEKQAATEQERIKSLKGQLEAAHKAEMAKIEESIKAAEKQEKAAKASKWMRWLGVVLAVVSLVATICTGGGAAAIAFAALGAAMSITTATLAETGGDKMMMKALAKLIMKCQSGKSEKDAEKEASIIISSIEAALGLACVIGGGVCAIKNIGQKAVVKGINKSVEATMKVIAKATMATGVVSSVANTSVGGVNSAFSYQATQRQADALEAQEVIRKIQKFLEESQEDLQEILEQLMNGVGDVIAMLDSQTDVLNKITSEIGAQNA